MKSEEVSKLIRLIQTVILLHPITCSGLEMMMGELTPDHVDFHLETPSESRFMSTLRVRVLHVLQQQCNVS